MQNQFYSYKIPIRLRILRSLTFHESSFKDPPGMVYYRLLEHMKQAPLWQRFETHLILTLIPFIWMIGTTWPGEIGIGISCWIGAFGVFLGSAVYTYRYFKSFARVRHVGRAFLDRNQILPQLSKIFNFSSHNKSSLHFLVS